MSVLPGINSLWELPEPLCSLVQDELEDGETVVWCGQPIVRQLAMRTSPIVVFAIPWTAFAIFGMAGAADFKMPDFKQGADLFPLFGIPFLLIGFGMLSAPFWMGRKAKKTVYVLTNRRAIIFDGGRSTRIRSFESDRLNRIERKQRSDGSGDVIFEKNLSSDSDGHHQIAEIGFLAIPNVKEVEGMVRQLIEKNAN